MLTDDPAVNAATPAADAALSPLGEPPGGGLAEARILVLDDEPVVARIICRHLRDAGYRRPTPLHDPSAALSSVLDGRFDLVLTDLVMPEVDGLALLEAMAGSGLGDRLPPVVVLSGSTDRPSRIRALRLGAADFLPKPVDPVELAARVRNVLQAKAHRDWLRDHAARLERAVRARTEELEASRRDVIRCLARAAEFRDDDTGRHVARVGRYARIVAERLGLPPAEAELIEEAAQLHDVGKIGLPDAILLKPAGLTDEEIALMRRHVDFGEAILGCRTTDPAGRHAEIGAAILAIGRSPILAVAARIALTHHERWDGSGYPRGLAGEAIPLEGRIAAVCDVFDALSSRRPYKPPLPPDRCLAILEAGRGTQFDPRVLDAFLAARAEILAVCAALSDGPAHEDHHPPLPAEAPTPTR